VAVKNALNAMASRRSAQCIKDPRQENYYMPGQKRHHCDAGEQLS